MTWENKSVHTEFVTTFRNFDFSVGRVLTYELKKSQNSAIAPVIQSALILRGPEWAGLLDGASDECILAAGLGRGAPWEGMLSGATRARAAGLLRIWLISACEATCGTVQIATFTGRAPRSRLRHHRTVDGLVEESGAARSTASGERVLSRNAGHLQVTKMTGARQVLDGSRRRSTALTGSSCAQGRSNCTGMRRAHTRAHAVALLRI